VGVGSGGLDADADADADADPGGGPRANTHLTTVAIAERTSQLLRRRSATNHPSGPTTH
jgi:hypothetical protein